MKAKKLMLMFVFAFVPMFCMAQQIGTHITLSGTGGSGTGTVGSLSVASNEGTGSLSSVTQTTMTLPEEVSTALDNVDIEDVEISIRSGRIEINAQGDYTCNVYEMTGRLVAMQNAMQPVSINLTSGMYIVAISRQGKVVCARKVTIK